MSAPVSRQDILEMVLRNAAAREAARRVAEAMGPVRPITPLERYVALGIAVSEENARVAVTDATGGISHGA